MVEGFVGLPGSAKTYSLVVKGLEALSKNRPVYANFSLQGAIYFQKISDILQVRNGVILIDEINLSFPSRMWNKVPGWVLYYWSQTRKFGLDIYYTSQSLKRVDTVIREVSNYTWVCKKLPFGFYMRSKFVPEELESAKRLVLDRKFFRLDKSVYTKYNTFEILEISESYLTNDKTNFNQTSFTNRK